MAAISSIQLFPESGLALEPSGAFPTETLEIRARLRRTFRRGKAGERFVITCRVRAGFDLVHHSVGLNREKRVKDPGHQIHPKCGPRSSQFDTVANGTVLFEGEEHHRTPQDDPCFGFGWVKMAMRANVAVQLHGVEHAMQGVLLRPMKRLDHATPGAVA